MKNDSMQLLPWIFIQGTSVSFTSWSREGTVAINYDYLKDAIQEI